VSIKLSDDQQSALDTILDWSKGAAIDPDDRPHIIRGATLTLGGYAGTGKTTLLGQLPRYFPGKHIHFASYTGKAVSVLKQKLPAGSEVSTLHRLLYRPRPQNVCKLTGEVVLYAGGTCPKHTPTGEAPEAKDGCETVKKLEWSPVMNPLHGIDLVVVDEASMVNDKIWTDLTRWGVPVLAVGDHGQLPPIKSEFNLMEKPDIRLERILRQAEGSPIIQMSIQARTRGGIRNGDYGQGCVKISRSQMINYEMDPDNGDLIIVGYNRTRNELNDAMRSLLGRSGTPKVGDIVICLRNNYEAGIFNGMRGRIKEIEIAKDDTAFATIGMMDEGFDFTGEIYLPQFRQPKTQQQVGRWLSLFDYGYAMTCHKAQGSQADRVMVIEEYLPQSDPKRWLYTAVTRAAKELIVVGQR